MFGKKENSHPAKDTEPQSPLSRLRQRFRKNRLARWSWRILKALLLIALLADFIANEKPLWCKIEGKHHFPILRQYAVDLGWAKQDPRFFLKEWSEHDYEAVVFPPIPYAAMTLDLKNSGYKSPFDTQKISSLRWRHWLGTDKLGHDVAAGLVAGTRVAMLVGIIAMSVATAIGILLGSLAGFFGDKGLRISLIRLIINAIALFFAWFYGFQARSQGGFWTGLLIAGGVFLVANVLAFFLEKTPFRKTVYLPLDLLVMRTIEVLNSIPGMLLLLAVVAVIEKSSIFYVMLVIGLIRWTGIARYLRAELLRVRNLGYVEAARALGYSEWRILFRHALPNALTPVITAVAFGVAGAILLESGLSFIGIGTGEGITWGKLLGEARNYPAAWWLAVFPGLAIFVTVTACNLIGEGLNEQ